jgi:hypothetical protein
LKDRAQAFRTVLQTLSNLPLHRIMDIATSSLHSGPAQLGSLSDAISEARTNLRNSPLLQKRTEMHQDTEASHEKKFAVASK